MIAQRPPIPAPARPPLAPRDRIQPRSVTPSFKVLFTSPSVGLIRFKCAADHPSWNRELTIAGCAISLARTPVVYRLDSWRGDTVNNHNSAVFVNGGQLYRRRPLTEQGLLCDTLAIDNDVLVEAIRPFDPGVVDRPHSPFVINYALTPPSAVLTVRRLSAELSQVGPVDALEIEERLVNAAAELIAASYTSGPGRLQLGIRHRLSTDRAHRDIVENVKTIIALRPDDRWTLHSLAREAHTSAFHLARIFKSHTGASVHAYLRSLRVRLAYDRIAASPRGNLANVALECGFASHSHLTRAFIEELGIRPSQVRDRPSAGGARHQPA